MGLHEGALSRLGEERDACVRGACAGELVYDAATARGVIVSGIWGNPGSGVEIGRHFDIFDREFAKS